MKNRTVIIAAAGLMLASALASRAAQRDATIPPPELHVNIDTRQTARSVSQYEDGMFIEHIGQLIYRSLWSEMLDDRKFYFPIKSEEPQTVPAQGGPFRNMKLRNWHPIGPDEAILMDKDQPFVGEQSPRIKLDAFTAWHPPIRFRDAPVAPYIRWTWWLRSAQITNPSRSPSSTRRILSKSSI